jgi:uncharacterized protein YjbI with pentapeptide repeats
LINVNFSGADLINIKFKNCTILTCDFSNCKMQDVLFEDTIRSKCDFNNIEIIDNVVGLSQNIITENSDKQFIETVKQLDLHNH